MMHHKNQYFSLNRILLLAIGLWPYQQSKLVRFQFISFFIILTGVVIFQLTTFVTSKCTPYFILKILSSVLFTITFVIKYGSFRINIETVKDLLAQLQHLCDELKDENEIAIIEKYSYNAKRYTIVLTVFAVCSIVATITNQFTPLILNIILSTNESQSHQLQFMTEYFIDQEKYFYLIALHVNAAACIGATTIIAIGSMFIAYFQHTCGMFRIASYRIEHAIYILQNANLRDESLISKQIICAVYIHREAMKLSELLVSTFEVSFFSLTVFGVACLSLNLLRIFQIVTSGDDVKEFLRPFLLTSIIITYMFLANYVGQNVTDHNNHIFTTIYNVQWYVAPLQIQRMLLFLLQRNTKEFFLSVGGLLVASLECFATLVNASISYFTVIFSMR